MMRVISFAAAMFLAAQASAGDVGAVRLCAGYGPSFFAVSATDGCIRIGGLVIAEAYGADLHYKFGPVARPAGAVRGAAPGPSAMSPVHTGADALGRVEIDIRQPTEASPVRAFLRVDSVVRPFTQP